MCDIIPFSQKGCVKTMKINNKKIMAWMIVFLLVIQLVLPTITFANDEDN